MTRNDRSAHGEAVHSNGGMPRRTQLMYAAAAVVEAAQAVVGLDDRIGRVTAWAAAAVSDLIGVVDMAIGSCVQHRIG